MMTGLQALGHNFRETVNKLPATILSAPFWILAGIIGAFGIMLLVAAFVFAIIGEEIQKTGNK